MPPTPPDADLPADRRDTGEPSDGDRSPFTATPGGTVQARTRPHPARQLAQTLRSPRWRHTIRRTPRPAVHRPADSAAVDPPPTVRIVGGDKIAVWLLAGLLTALTVTIAAASATERYGQWHDQLARTAAATIADSHPDLTVLPHLDRRTVATPWHTPPPRPLDGPHPWPVVTAEVHHDGHVHVRTRTDRCARTSDDGPVTVPCHPAASR